MLLREWYLSLQSELDVFQTRIRTTIRSDTGQYPAAAFLVHQTTRPVDRIHDDAPNDVRLSRPTRQNDLTITQSFGDEQDRRGRRHFALDKINQHLFANA